MGVQRSTPSQDEDPKPKPNNEYNKGSSNKVLQKFKTLTKTEENPIKESSNKVLQKSKTVTKTEEKPAEAKPFPPAEAKPSKCKYSPHRKVEGSYIEDSNHPGSFKVLVNALNIIWGNDSRFWKVLNLSEEETNLTGFKDSATLHQVNWIEVTGKVCADAFKPPPSKYEIHYILKFKVDAFGWDNFLVEFMVRINGNDSVKMMMLKAYNEQKNVWHEVPGGEFSVVTKTTNNYVHFGMLEVKTDWWKGGMVLAGIKIKPKADRYRAYM